MAGNEEKCVQECGTKSPKESWESQGNIPGLRYPGCFSKLWTNDSFQFYGFLVLKMMHITTILFTYIIIWYEQIISVYSVSKLNRWSKNRPTNIIFIDLHYLWDFEFWFDIWWNGIWRTLEQTEYVLSSEDILISRGPEGWIWLFVFCQGSTILMITACTMFWLHLKQPSL